MKARVRKTGVTLSEVARRAGISESAAHKCLYRCTPAGNRAIARHLGVRLHALWPEWFNHDGSRLLPDAENRTRSSRSGHCQKGRAA
ncbi:helix-turn-helix domain-containing protein [Marivibrio sp.]|uniref:helix-turn-helix domain-containing protein n=1 Tax=Marivibrio sp. TaxID=2039719 RepID=UPI0032EB59FA